MKRTFFAVILIAASFAYVYAQDEPATAPSQAQERSIVVPRDDTPFSVTKSETVRLTGKGIAGAAITAKVDGPAKLIYANAISERSGGHPLVGPGNKEFEIKPTGRGKVTVTITSKGPQPDAKPVVTKYEFDVAK